MATIYPSFDETLKNAALSRVIVFASIVQVVIASMFMYTLIISPLISHVYIKYNAFLMQRNYVWTIVTQKENKTR